MILQTSIKEELKNTLNGLFKDSYETHLNGSFDNFLNIMISQIEKEVDALISIDNVFMRNIINVHKRQKRRISNKLINEINSIEEMINTGTIVNSSSFSCAIIRDLTLSCQIYYSCQIEKNLSKFKLLYNADCYEDYKELIIKDMEKWVSSCSNYISTSKYLNILSIKKIEKIFEKDIILAAYKFLFENYEFGRNTKYSMLPQSLSNIPVDHTNKRQITNCINNTWQDIYIIDDDRYFETTINFTKKVDTLLKDSMSKVLNQTDISVINYLVSISTDDFFVTKRVTCDLGDIVKHLFPTSRNSKDYMIVKTSILKITFYTFMLVDKKLRQKPYRIFSADISVSSSDKDEDMYDKKKQNREVVTALFSEEFVNDIIKNGPISVNDDIVQNYKIKASKILVYSLQAVRYSLIKENSNLIKELNYNYFRSVLYLPGSNKAQNKKTLIKSLTEIKESGIVIKDFKNVKDIFTIEFIPISAEEKLDLTNLIQSFSIRISNPTSNLIILPDK